MEQNSMRIVFFDVCPSQLTHEWYLQSNISSDDLNSGVMVCFFRLSDVVVEDFLSEVEGFDLDDASDDDAYGRGKHAKMTSVSDATAHGTQLGRVHVGQRAERFDGGRDALLGIPKKACGFVC